MSINNDFVLKVIDKRTHNSETRSLQLCKKLGNIAAIKNIFYFVCG